MLARPETTTARLLEGDKIDYAARLWARGQNTAAIAKLTERPEHVVARSLEAIRKRAKAYRAGSKA